VDDERGLCPSGWHVPSDVDFITMEVALGMSESDANSTLWRGTDQGSQLKSSAYDDPSWNGTNSSGFSALNGGYRTWLGNMSGGGEEYGNYWGQGGIIQRMFAANQTDVYRYIYTEEHFKRDGFSVRCLKGSNISGCTDSEATNYDSTATADDGSCIYPPGPCNNQTSVTYYGYEYDVVEIGDQCWFAENLRTEFYRNGDPLLGNLSSTEWTTAAVGAQVVYGDDNFILNGGNGDEANNLLDYGRLYNGYAIGDPRRLCPIGWHVPSDDEYMILEMELGMSEIDANSVGWRGTDQAHQLKSSFEDLPSWNGSNSSGFSGLPGGRLYPQGIFNLEGDGDGHCNFWDSSNGGRVIHQSAGIYRSEFIPSNYGYSVRCIYDTIASGCTIQEACNYDPLATLFDDSCFYPGDACDDNDEFTENDAYSDNCECAGTEVEIVPGCVYETACNFNPEANQDDMSCVFPGDSCDDSDVTTGNDAYTDDCECIGEPLAGGCTYKLACNFNPEAQFDDNSCVFIGDSCDDGDSETDGDAINGDCECVGNPVTSVNQLDVKYISVYPNPVSDQLTVELGSLWGTSVQVKVFDSQGKLVFDENRIGTFIIDISTYETGVYSINVESDSEWIKGQFIVE
jgi:uncharacterized protein (TIGR02145 family)